MARATTSDTSGLPEFAVNRETISAYFHPPLPKSTFYDLVSSGKVIPLQGIKGMYKLNESLKRLGMREVPTLPSQASSRSMEDIVRLAFSMLDPTIFPIPSWYIFSEQIRFRDEEQAKELADLYRSDVEAQKSLKERIAFASGVLDGYYDLERRHFAI